MMSEEPITLTGREQQRAGVLNRALAGVWTHAEAAAILGLSAQEVLPQVVTARPWQ